jgi:hypothetical protein
MNLYTPDGQLCGTAQSGAEDFTAPVTALPGDFAGQVWSLEITRADEEILEDNTLTLPEPLAPVLSLAPEHVFRMR